MPKMATGQAGGFEELLEIRNISEERVDHLRSSLLTGTSRDEVEIDGVSIMTFSLCDLIIVRVERGSDVACT